jgi:hypothetical protein
MDVTRDEAQESLAAIQEMARRMRRAAADNGAHNFLILWGVVWLFGFTCSQFMAQHDAKYVWMGLNLLGALGSWWFGRSQGRCVRSKGDEAAGRRIGLFWATLLAYCPLTVWIAWPLNGRQLAMFIIIFVMIGWLAMSFLLSYSAYFLALFITAVAFGSYFLLPAYFYLSMALVGGGAMIGSGIYIRSKWRNHERAE